MQSLFFVSRAVSQLIDLGSGKILLVSKFLMDIIVQFLYRQGAHLSLHFGLFQASFRIFGVFKEPLNKPKLALNKPKCGHTHVHVGALLVQTKIVQSGFHLEKKFRGGRSIACKLINIHNIHYRMFAPRLSFCYLHSGSCCAYTIYSIPEIDQFCTSAVKLSSITSCASQRSKGSRNSVIN